MLFNEAFMTNVYVNVVWVLFYNVLLQSLLISARPNNTNKAIKQRFFTCQIPSQYIQQQDYNLRYGLGVFFLLCMYSTRVKHGVFSYFVCTVRVWSTVFFLVLYVQYESEAQCFFLLCMCSTRVKHGVFSYFVCTVREWSTLFFLVLYVQYESEAWLESMFNK